MKDVKRFEIRFTTIYGPMMGKKETTEYPPREYVSASDYDELLIEFNKMKQFRDDLFQTAVDQTQELLKTINELRDKLAQKDKAQCNRAN